MTLKEYLEEQIKIYSNFLENADGTTILTSGIPRIKSTIRLFEGFLKELEELKETKWAPVVGEYCWFIEGTMEMEGDTLHLCKVIDIVTSGGYAEWARNKLENTYRVVTTTEEVHEVPLSNLEKFEGTLPSVIRRDND